MSITTPIITFNGDYFEVGKQLGKIYKKNGMNFEEIYKVKKETGSVVNYNGAERKKSHEIIHTDADILITAAIPDLIKPSDVNKIKFNLIAEGSNIPMNLETEELLHEKGVLIIPDIIANAGGVISSYVEYIGGSEEQMFRTVEEKITKNVRHILELSKEEEITPREAALKIAKKRVSEGIKS